jgi:hypothetical protein
MKNKFQAKYYLKLKYFIPPVLHLKTCTENNFKKAQEAYDLGCKLSIVNYAKKLWKSKLLR